MAVYFRFIICFSVVWASCNLNDHSTEDDVALARVKDDYLYLSEISHLFQGANYPVDSAKIIDNYIESWIKKRIIAQEARKNLKSYDKYLNQQLEDYELSLLGYLYEKELINQKLNIDTEDKELQAYLDKYGENFLLNENVFNIKLLKFNERPRYVDSIKLWLKTYDENAQISLEEICEEDDVTNCMVTSDIWLNYNELLAVAPARWYSEQNLMSRKSLIEVADSSGYYVIKVSAYKLKGEVPPLNYVKEDIKKIILNKRKQSLIKNMHNTLYQKALKKSQFEKFYQ